MVQKHDTVIVESPGRINLIGEHIDYNGGSVLPAAIDQRVTLTLRRTDTSECTIRSESFQDAFTCKTDTLTPSRTAWHNYVLGVIHQIHELFPGAIRGFDCVLSGNLPIGSGISSSAALECGLATGLNELFHVGLSREQIIHLSRKAEHTFVGTKCGIMDQFAVVNGRKDHFLLLNCQSLAYRHIPADLHPYELVLINTNVSHQLSQSAYNTRLEECQSALDSIRRKHPEFQFLADIPIKLLESFERILSQEVYRRALYVVQENQRVKEASSLVVTKNLPALGNLLYESHAGLRHQYEVSCPELDFMVDFSNPYPEVLGSRLMGGGFGGCTINLIHKDFTPAYLARLSESYCNTFGFRPTSFKVALCDGVSVKGKKACPG